jgi:hypothetical protein
MPAVKENCEDTGFPFLLCNILMGSTYYGVYFVCVSYLSLLDS